MIQTNKMCPDCNDLQVYLTIQKKTELEAIINQLKCKITHQNLLVFDKVSQKEMSDFLFFDIDGQANGTINIKFTCKHCASEYKLFADTYRTYTGFFSPKD